MRTPTKATLEPEPVHAKAVLREFVSKAMHDVREPLRAIRTSSELLAGLCPDSNEATAQQCSKFIRDGVDRLETLVRDIAEYCYATARDISLNETDMNGVLLEAKRQISEELKKQQATITEDPLPVVSGDFFALAAVFRSLFENACKFRGSVAPSIHVGAAKQGSDWIVSVTDNGIGFDAAYSERIFRPFERLNGKQFPGSGLGLPIVRRIIEQHGGRMWAESQPGQGSIFSFSLPATD